MYNPRLNSGALLGSGVGDNPALPEATEAAQVGFGA